MSLLQNEQIRLLDFQWMKLTGPNCLCSQTIHPGLSCLEEVFFKFKTVIKTVSKFYLIFHLIPFFLKMKKAARQKRLLNYSLRAGLSFIGSIVFMAHLVCGLKGSIQPSLLCGGPLTGLSIFWQSPGRRQQIAYYAFVRSIRAVYFYLLRRNILKYEVPKQLFFVLFSGILSFIFMQKTQNLKYANYLKALWGQI